MAATFQTITLSAVGEGDGSYAVSGVFWLNAPANAQIPQPQATSVVTGISQTDLAAIRSGAVVEQAFTTTPFAPGTAQATVDAAIDALANAAQTALNNTNPALATTIRRARTPGVGWAAFPGVVPGLQIGSPNLPILTELYAAIAMGQLPNIKAGRAAGYVSTAATGNVKVRATAYTPQGANAQRSIVSTSANDTAAGTGARTVTINYLTAAFVAKSETVTLNGTTAVNTVNVDIAYLESMVVASVGTAGGTNAGTINIKTATAGGGSTWGSIAVSDNQTFWAHHYVPTGVTCYVINVSGGSTASATAVAGQVTIHRTGDPSSSTLPELGIGGFYPHLAGGNEDHPFAVPIAVPGPDLVVLLESPSGAGATNFFAAFEYFQV
jgi:hypothetical protein